MFRLILFFFLFIVSVLGFSQELNWIYKVGSTSLDYGTSLTIDAGNNILDITSFTGNASISVLKSVTSRGSEDILIRKSNRQGIQLWIAQIGSKKSDFGYSITTDTLGNAYVAGTFSDSLFYNDTYIVKSANDRLSSFIIKISSTGQFQWVKLLESTSSVEARTVTAIIGDSLIVSGFFQDETNFESSENPITLTSTGANDIFVMKMSSVTGRARWVKSIGGIDHDYAFHHAIDKLGNIIMTGEFRQISDFNPGAATTLVTSQGLNDIFVCKLNKLGNLIWVKTYGGNGIDVGAQVAIDHQNNIIGVGRFSEMVKFGSGPDPVLTSAGGQDGYVIKIKADGSTQWVNQYGNMQNDQANCVVTNITGVIFVGGIFRQSVDFDSDQVNSQMSSSKGGADNFVLTINQDGSYNSHYTFGGIANDQINAVQTTYISDIITCGGFGAIVDFDPSMQETNIISSGGLDGFFISIYKCIAPYIKKLSIDKSAICHGEKGIIKIEEGYLNGAIQWSWSRDNCASLNFATGDFIDQKFVKDQTFFVRGTGGCVQNSVCDSISIDVFTDTLNYVYREACQGESIVVGANVYNRTGVYVDSLISAFGCDSVIITELTILPKFNKVNDYSICPGDSIIVGNNVYKFAGNYTDIFQAQNGCDSTVISSVVVKNNVITNTELTICNGDTITISGIKYSKEGVYIQEKANPNGCLDLFIIKINVIPTHYFISHILCEGDIHYVGNSAYSKNGFYIDSLEALSGCDSIVFSDLTFLKNITLNVTYPLCQGDSVVIGSSVYKTPGTYTDILTRRNGCDSIIFSLVVLNPRPAAQTFDYTICEGQNVVVGNKSYSIQGIYVDTLQNNNGCDSIVTSRIKVIPKFYTQNAAICQGETYRVGSSTFTLPGSYNINLKNSVGCDSVVVLNLKVNLPSSFAYNGLICPGDTLRIHNRTFTRDGIYRDTLSNIKGCDSLIAYNIKYNHITQNQFHAFCSGEFVEINGKLYDKSGLYADTLQRVNGCDSIFNILIEVKPTSEIDTFFQLCKGETITIGGSTYSSPGKFTEFLTSTNGCDSILNFEIKFINFLPFFNVKGDSLITAAIPGAQYQWYECVGSDLVMILGANLPAFKLQKNGRYSLGITYNGCTYYSDCIDVVISSTNTVLLDNIEIYPNPARDFILLDVPYEGDVKVIDVFGRVVCELGFSSGKQEIDVSTYQKGTYFLQLSHHKSVVYLPFIKL